MRFFLIARFLLAATLFLIASNATFAQQTVDETAAGDAVTDSNEGQADLDAAVVQRLDAKTAEDFEAVSALLESAIKKGLDEENSNFAKKMLGSVLLQRSQQIASQMMRFRGRRVLQVRDEAVEGLMKAVENDPSLVEAHIMIAQLSLLPEGDVDGAIEAATSAIKLLKDDPKEQSAAYVVRAKALVMQGDEARLAEDLDAAVEKDDKNLQAFQMRAALRMKNGNVEEALADLEHILAQDPTNSGVAGAAVQQLLELDRVSDAIELLSKTLEAKPSEGLYRLRARLLRFEGKEDEALRDLNKALALQPRDPDALLDRAEISLFNKDIQSAKRDLKAASAIDPRVENSEPAIFVRCLIAVEEGRMADAINDMKILVARNPGSVRHQLQLANLFQQDERPRKAIDVYSSILDRDPNNAGILRTRGDALLSVGDHTSAIADYERAIKVVSSLSEEEQQGVTDFPGILNNLAWVLCTSPNDSIRDGKRAVELGEQAAELTEYKEAHILSTLAAGYAETGDFEKAIEWSNKAVELGREEEHAQIEQLEKELESYQKGEAWREIQETEENEIPILSPDDLIDT